MAIQMRRGQLADFNPDKMLPGEWAVSTDSTSSNQHVYMCFAPGVVKRMATYEDFEDDMEALSTAIQTANAAAAAANQAAQDVAQIIADKFGIDDTTPSTTTAYSSSKIENTFSKLIQLSKEDFPETGDSKALYIDISTGRAFYWTASGYAQIDGDAAYISESAVSEPEEEAAPSQLVNANGNKKYPVALTNGVYRVDGTLLETLLANTVDKLKDVATSGKASDVSLSPISGMEATTVQEGVSELNSKIIKRVSMDDNNVTSISVNVSSLQTSQYSRFFVVTVGRWNGSDTFSAIGTYKYSGTTSEVGASVLQSNIPGMSINLTAGGILTASWTSSWSYVQIVAFDLFAPV